MGLRYATVTGVARDDLPDGGAWLYAETVRQIHALKPGSGVEMLIPDFNARPRPARPRCSAPGPRCSRTTSRPCRGSSSGSGPAFRYERSLDGDHARPATAGLVTKSNLILGMGEEPRRGHRRRCATCTTPAASCSPSPSTCARRRATTRSSAGSSPRSSSSSREEAEAIGFAGVMSGPLVRSSYRAGRLYQQAVAARGEPRA